MSSENLHAPRERLTQKTLNLHFAIVSLMEEFDAIDWYRQRADDAEDETLKELLLHNMREEMEHASMLLEWIRRRDSDFERFLKTYLFTEGSILQEEKAATAGGVDRDGSETSRRGSDHPGFTIGSLRGA
ncbi:MAG TPA: ferritin [Stellaceae bacterium]|nr:ferritin [Stellaceae bacterium]